jgi:DNA-directed RNA polymerase specialized sigma24 family protein
MVTTVNTGSGGPRRWAPNPEPMLRAADRRRLERAVERRRRAERDLLELVRELRERDASVIEIAEVLGITRHGVYKMLRRGED